VRSFLGLLGAAFVCSYTYFNDWIMRQTMFVGNFMPISVYGLLVLFLGADLSALAAAVAQRGLKRSELAVMLVLTLVSCAIPGSNLLRLFTPALIMPHRYERTEPGWRQQEVMKLVPEGMLVDISEDESTVLDGYTRGLKEASDKLSFSEVPWKAWRSPLLFWVPIILSLWIALVSLAVVVHRQWSDHEHLPYPIVTFTKSLLPEEDGRPSPVFGNPLLDGAGGGAGHPSLQLRQPVVPEVLFGQIPLGVDFSLADGTLGHLRQGRRADAAGKIHDVFHVIAVAYFLPKEVSLSLGIGPFIWIFIAGLFATYGVGVGGWQGTWPFGLQMDAMMIMGAYFGMLMVLLFTGRQYYSAVFRRAFGFSSAEPVESSAVWGARFFMLGMGFFTVYAAILVGLDWPIALLFGLGCVAVYLVMGRLLAETGLFFIVVTGTPATLLWACSARAPWGRARFS
jgi:hypothetical protein